MRRALRLPSYISMEYKKHEDSLNDHFSYRNPSSVWRAPTTANKQGAFSRVRCNILYSGKQLYSALLCFIVRCLLLIRGMCNHLNLSSSHPFISSLFCLLVCLSVCLHPILLSLVLSILISTNHTSMTRCY